MSSRLAPGSQFWLGAQTMTESLGLHRSETHLPQRVRSASSRSSPIAQGLLRVYPRFWERPSRGHRQPLFDGVQHHQYLSADRASAIQPAGTGRGLLFAAWPSRRSRLRGGGSHLHWSWLSRTQSQPSMPSGPGPVVTGLPGGALTYGAPGRAQRVSVEVAGTKELAVAAAGGSVLHDPAGSDAVLDDLLWGGFGAEHLGDSAAMAALVIHCHKGDLVLSLELTADLAV
jgi:hypothetical protein